MKHFLFGILKILAVMVTAIPFIAYLILRLIHIHGGGSVKCNRFEKWMFKNLFNDY